VLVDAARGFGNQKLLPAGPLREPLERLSSVDMVVFNGEPSAELQNLVAQYRQADQQTQYSLSMAINGLRDLSDNSLQSADLSYLNRYSVIHLVAGIGHPERFFNAVRLLLSNNENAPRIVEHAFPDHYSYKESDLAFADNHSSSNVDEHAAIVMTAKDAVKCGGFKQNALPLYAIDVSANVDSQLTANLCAQLAN
jgi:tetraacyldisaccharide 4'-kinase